MDLDLSLTASFLVLARERHFGRAAARLHVTSSALTKRIQHLERQLGVPLVERCSGGVYLTPAGSRFVREAGPLLAHADAVRRVARTAMVGPVLRLGFPAGSGPLWHRIGMAAVAAEIRRSFPQARLIVRDIPFDELRTCVPDGLVDVLWTNAPVRHRSVESVPLGVSAELLGVVGIHHRFADAGAVEVGEFSDERMLINPAAPPEWMGPFWLEDVRPRRVARLIEIEEMDAWSVLRRLAVESGVMTTLKIVAPPLGRALRPVQLLGAAPMVIHVARRRSDLRAEVRALIAALDSIAPSALSTIGAPPPAAQVAEPR